MPGYCEIYWSMIKRYVGISCDANKRRHDQPTAAQRKYRGRGAGKGDTPRAERLGYRWRCMFADPAGRQTVLGVCGWLQIA